MNVYETRKKEKKVSPVLLSETDLLAILNFYQIWHMFIANKSVSRRSVNPTFLFRNSRILFAIISKLSEIEQKINVESSKNLKVSVHGTLNPTILRLQGAWNYGR